MLNSLAGMSIPCFLMLYELVSMLQNVTAWPLREKKKKKKKIYLLYHENILPAGKQSSNFFFIGMIIQAWKRKNE